MKVLLVSAERGVAPPWAAGDGTRFELSHATSIAAAVDRLAHEHVDAVVIDARSSSDDVAQRGLCRLREHARGTALLFDGERDATIGRSPFIDGMLPDHVAPAVQAEYVALAAERAALDALLEQRTSELQLRLSELERSRAHFRDVIERNVDAIIVVDREGVIRFANAMAAELFGNAREELVGTAFGFPAVAGATTELDLVHGAESRVVEMRVVGSEWEGEEACIASLRDITERKRAEESARTLIREQAARAAAEVAAQRFRFLAESSALLSASLDYRSTLAALAQLCVGDVADWAVIYTTDESGAVRRLEIAHRDTTVATAVRELQNAPFEADTRHPVLNVVRSRRPVLARTVDEEMLAAIVADESHRSLIGQLGMSSFMIVPLIARNRCLGAIALVTADPNRSYNEQDLAQAQDLALRAALAVDNARLYHKAYEANQAKTDLLAVISHDLRTPLNAIIGHADLLAMGLPEPLGDATLERVGRIQTSAHHLLYLIDELLSYARLEAGRAELRLQDVDARMLARDVGAVIEPLALQRQLRFAVDIRTERLALRTDPDKLRQVLLNLTGNAVKYTAEGAVQLSVRAVDDSVVFAVHDTGVGIRDEHLPHIFEPFWQVDAAPRSRDSGTGLGLSVVQRLVQLLGGGISVQSTVGQGSTFTVTLPCNGPLRAPVAPSASSHKE